MELKGEVIDRGLCTLCGMCLGRCPYVKAIDDRLAVVFSCGIESGRCYLSCPRTPTDWDAVEASVMGEGADYIPELGRVIKLYMVRGTEPRLTRNSQDGGTVTTLLAVALETGMMEAGVVTSTDDGLIPLYKVARNEQEVIKASGSRYLAATGLKAWNEALKQDITKLGVVGRPCQVMAVRKQEFNFSEELKGRSFLVIGLFCMWTLAWDFNDYLKGLVGAKRIRKVSIPKGELKVELEDGVLTRPVEEIRRFARQACGYCWDMTSELADLSVGALEAVPGWNTLIIRTPKGEELVSKARTMGWLEVREYPEESLKELLVAARGKKERAVQELKKVADSGQIIVDLDKPRFSMFA